MSWWGPWDTWLSRNKLWVAWKAVWCAIWMVGLTPSLAEKSTKSACKLALQLSFGLAFIMLHTCVCVANMHRLLMCQRGPLAISAQCCGCCV